MKAFMKNLGPSNHSKEKLITANLIQKLSESVKDIQMKQNGGNFLGLNEGDGSTALCITLEAIFLHGLKDSLLDIAAKAFVSDLDQRSEASFWSCLLVFSHRQIIDQIQSLKQVNTEVGYCRAWLRIALNDSLLSSYLVSMQRDSHILKQFYKQTAFIRDSDLLDVAINLINGVESCTTFDLAVNTSLLNYWSHPPLLLAGLWSPPPLKSCPVSAGIDIAMSLDATVPESVESSINVPSPETSGIGQFTVLNEGEALRIILEKSTELNLNGEEVMGKASGTGRSPERDTSPSLNESNPILTSSTNTNSSGIGNSINAMSRWSFEPGKSNAELRESERFDGASLSPEKFIEPSYNALVDNYHSNSDIARGMILSIPIDDELEASTSEKKRRNTNDSLLVHLGYEVIPKSPNSYLTPDFNFQVAQMGILAKEKGLDSQNYNCNSCGHSLGINFAKPRFCGFLGMYYCEECMSLTPHIIPARVIYNWDFRKYAISLQAEKFLNEFKLQPLVNFKVLNPNIYGMIDKMAELQSLRIQLNFLRAYLYTCREPIIEQLQRRLWPREYIYECIHKYSIYDLELIPDNTLVNQLEEVVTFAKSHVFSCWLCSQKGFICEICKKPKVLYPFDLTATFRCELCNAVFHRECISSSRECPKCERQKKRQHLPLLEIVKAQ